MFVSNLHLRAQSFEAQCCYKLVGRKSEVAPPKSAELRAPESRPGAGGSGGALHAIGAARSCWAPENNSPSLQNVTEC